MAELSPSITDEEVLRQASDRGALLMTADKDLGELVFRQGRVHAGVVLVRLAGLSAGLRADTITKVLQDHSVISPNAVRIRKAPDSGVCR